MSEPTQWLVAGRPGAYTLTRLDDPDPANPKVYGTAETVREALILMRDLYRAERPTGSSPPTARSD